MELNNMILIYIEGNLIENMIIQDNQLLFSDTDSESNTIYKTVPVNEYEEGTASSKEVYKIFDYLNFRTEEGLEAFKECCLENFIEGNLTFDYDYLEVRLEEIEKDNSIVIV